jgi:hypothetical protein
MSLQHFFSSLEQVSWSRWLRGSEQIWNSQADQWFCFWVILLFIRDQRFSQLWGIVMWKWSLSRLIQCKSFRFPTSVYLASSRGKCNRSCHSSMTIWLWILFERSFTHWSKHLFQKMSGVRLNCLDLNLIVLKRHIHCCFERTNCAEVESSRRFGKRNIPWTNSPKEAEKLDMDGSINMNRGDKSSFSVTLRARSENICSWTLTPHLELYSFLRWSLWWRLYFLPLV